MPQVPQPAPLRTLPEELVGRARPLVPAGERLLRVDGPLGQMLPGGGLPQGSVVTIGGAPGTGGSSLLLQLLAAGTAGGAWVGVVDPEATLGGLAAFEAGVDLGRLVVVRNVPGRAWSRVVGVLLDGFAVVAGRLSAGIPASEARRLAARARERGAILLVAGTWPVEAGLHLRVEGSAWPHLGRGDGLLGDRAMRVRVVGRGAAARERVGEVALSSQARAS